MIDMNDEFRAIAPPIKRMEAIAIPEVETLGLPSGAMLHIYNNTDNDFSHITVLTPGGQAESRTPGISALRSMMMREGTADYSGEEIAAILDYNGAWIKTASTRTIHSPVCSRSTRGLKRCSPPWSR